VELVLGGMGGEMSEIVTKQAKLFLRKAKCCIFFQKQREKCLCYLKKCLFVKSENNFYSYFLENFT
jgi:hypothetical protein